MKVLWLLGFTLSISYVSATEYTWFFENPDAQAAKPRQSTLARVLQGIGAVTVSAEALHHLTKPIQPSRHQSDYKHATPEEWSIILRDHHLDLYFNRIKSYRRTALVFGGFWALKTLGDLHRYLQEEDSLFRWRPKNRASVSPRP